MHLLSGYRFLILLSLTIFAQCKKGDETALVIIPDQNFLNELLDAGIDQDNDGQISHSEAEAAPSLFLRPSNIKDLSGIEAFINLDTLVVEVNPIASPDLLRQYGPALPGPEGLRTD